MEFLNLVNAVASQLNIQKIEQVCEMLEKLIVLGDQLEAAAANSVKNAVSSVESVIAPAQVAPAVVASQPVQPAQ